MLSNEMDVSNVNSNTLQDSVDDDDDEDSKQQLPFNEPPRSTIPDTATNLTQSAESYNKNKSRLSFYQMSSLDKTRKTWSNQEVRKWLKQEPRLVFMKKEKRTTIWNV